METCAQIQGVNPEGCKVAVGVQDTEEQAASEASSAAEDSMVEGQAGGSAAPPIKGPVTRYTRVQT